MRVVPLCLLLADHSEMSSRSRIVSFHGSAVSLNGTLEEVPNLCSFIVLVLLRFGSVVPFHAIPGIRIRARPALSNMMNCGKFGRTACKAPHSACKLHDDRDQSASHRSVPWTSGSSSM